jgi:1,2-diacylglycerol 3-beta-galactosyltransferase
MRAVRSPASAVSPKRFLFLFSDTGGGHRASAQAVKDEMARLYGDAAMVDMVDIFVEMRRWPFDRFPEWYPAAVGLNGVPWQVSYHLSDAPPVVNLLSRMVWPYAGPSLCHLLARHPADVMVSFHGVPNATLLLARRKMALRNPFAIVTLDLVSVHAGWFTPGAHKYIVPTEAARQRALRAGVTAKRLHVIGMPTRRSFVEVCDMTQTEARNRLGLPQGRPIVLMIGGGEGMGPLVPVVRAIAECKPDAYLAVIAGRNQALQDALQALDAPVPVRVEGFVTNIAVWMRAADVLVTKAGPNTLAEAFIAGLPLVLYAAIPGQEEGNILHVVKITPGCGRPSLKRRQMR